ncbi:hypothetical protein EV359DRAFT_87928 [Lentinula novae-zelandiae]|nr:hypothetical protein EV359DRAFT_87928 [Lentinula novae-zelandiae]
MTNSKGKETAGSSSKRREETQLSVDEQISELSKPMEVLQVHREEDTEEEDERPAEILQRHYGIPPLSKVTDYYKGDYSSYPQTIIEKNPEIRIITFQEKDGNILMDYVSFTGSFDYREIPAAHCSHLRDWRKEAVRYGSQFLKRLELQDFESKPLSRTERLRYSKELNLLMSFLTSWKFVTVNEKETAYAVIPDNYINLLKALRNILEDARIEYQIQGIPMPELPIWGKNALTLQWWDFNDLECIGACWRIQVEQFLAEITRAIGKSTVNQMYSKDSLTGRFKGQLLDKPLPPVIEDPGSISQSQFRQIRTEQYDNLRGNLRQPNLTSYGASQRFVQSFGNEEQRNQSRIKQRASSRTSQTSHVTRNRQGGGGDPPSEPSDDEDKGNGSTGRPPYRSPNGPGGPGDPGDNGSSHFPGAEDPNRHPSRGIQDPGNSLSRQNNQDIPRFDNKLKADQIPTWNGEMDKIINWEMQINDLAKRSSIIQEQLGYLVPT